MAKSRSPCLNERLMQSGDSTRDGGEETKRPQEKRAYEPPRLVFCGTVAELTLGMNGTKLDRHGTRSHSQ